MTTKINPSEISSIVKKKLMDIKELLQKQMWEKFSQLLMVLCRFMG